MKPFIIAGIGTEVGKTLVSAILVEALEADYWKPIQAGNLLHTDSDVIRSLISNKKTFIHKESVRLKKAMSPHAAAIAEKRKIRTDDFVLPKTKNKLLIELAGGIMVPFSDKELNLDLLIKWKLPVILVSRNYLGSINHTLLTVKVLQQHKIHISGLIFNGPVNPTTENVILKYTKLKCLARIKEFKHINPFTVKKEAEKLKQHFQTHELKPTRS